MTSLKHLAIIMDGNGRWAKGRNKPRLFGHLRGSRQLRHIIQAVAKRNIPYLTLYAFSLENWQRPADEVEHLMKILVRFLQRETALMMKEGIRLNAVGNFSYLPLKARHELVKAMQKTENNQKMTLTLALSYGARQEITEAMRRIALDYKEGKIIFDDINEEMMQKYLYTKDLPDPDLILRTSGEMRLSNFLLWQAAYSEIYISKKNWPDFNEKDLQAAIEEFERRERRFGKIVDKSVEAVIEQH
tara:strand:+ start:17245 stop:17979 length:735 start_codon:yes stop_codon:yes gene_type:complete